MNDTVKVVVLVVAGVIVYSCSIIGIGLYLMFPPDNSPDITVRMEIRNAEGEYMLVPMIIDEASNRSIVSSEDFTMAHGTGQIYTMVVNKTGVYNISLYSDGIDLEYKDYDSAVDPDNIEFTTTVNSSGRGHVNTVLVYYSGEKGGRIKIDITIKSPGDSAVWCHYYGVASNMTLGWNAVDLRFSCIVACL